MVVAGAVGFAMAGMSPWAGGVVGLALAVALKMARRPRSKVHASSQDYSDLGPYWALHQKSTKAYDRFTDTAWKEGNGESTPDAVLTDFFRWLEIEERIAATDFGPECFEAKGHSARYVDTMSVFVALDSIGRLDSDAPEIIRRLKAVRSCTLQQMRRNLALIERRKSKEADASKRKASR